MTAIASVSSVRLEVREIPKDRTRWTEIAQAAKKWFDLAQEKLDQACEKGGDGKQFSDSKIALHTIYSQVGGKALEIGGVLGVWICTCEGDGNMEGIAIMSKKTGYVYGLATHPKNLLHPGNTLAERVSGVGRALIHATANYCALTGISLTLTSLETSIRFYEKVGFVQMEEDETPNMALTLEKCRAMVKKDGFF